MNSLLIPGRLSSTTPNRNMAQLPCFVRALPLFAFVHLHVPEAVNTRKQSPYGSRTKCNISSAVAGNNRWFLVPEPY